MNPPRWVRRVLETAGGRNRYNEANYRVVWSNSRTTTVGGKWDYYLIDGETKAFPFGTPQRGIFVKTAVGYEELPKYWSYPNRWILEKWCPPDFYGSLESWWMQTSASIDGQVIAQEGPYPERGDYEFSYCFQDENGDFLDLTSELVRRVCAMIEHGRSFSEAQRKQALIRREEKKEKDEQSFRERIVSDAVLPFHGANGEIVLTDDLLPFSNSSIRH